MKPISATLDRYGNRATQEIMWQPWREREYLGHKPDSSNYGYMDGKSPVSCRNFEELRSYVAWDKSRKVKQVWTPSSPWLLPPEEVPELYSDVYHREQLYRKYAFRNSLKSEAIWLLLGFVYLAQNVTTGIFFILALVGVPVLQNIWNLRRSRLYNPKEALQDAEQSRFGIWLLGRRSPLTQSLVIAITIIWVVQFVSLFGHLGQDSWTPAGAVGLVKPAVWENGEWWRLFTATVMHSAIWHITFNMLALLILGKIVEAIAGWSWMALTFFVSAFVGSLFSLALLPATSIGSSGGIMGLLGFLLVLGYSKRGLLPAGLLRALLSSVGLIFLVGFVGFAIIDNAAHLGGLLGGALLGLIASKTSFSFSRSAVPGFSSVALRLSGAVATAGIAVTLVGTTVLLLRS